MRISDWSSDVCSSDLLTQRIRIGQRRRHDDLADDLNANEAQPLAHERLLELQLDTLPDTIRTVVIGARVDEDGALIAQQRQVPSRARPEIGGASGRERVCKYV